MISRPIVGPAASVVWATRHAAVLALALAAFMSARSVHPQSRPVESVFAAAPFGDWIAQGPKAELPWHPRISPPALTLHQRIAARVEVLIDGNEFAKRCCDGEAIALIQITDGGGHTYRNFAKRELKDAAPAFGQYMISLSWDVFLLPGEYTATIAFYYSGRNAHSLTSERLHVAALKHEPLPDAWRDLSAVEFWDSQPEGLDAFLLPNINGRLRLPAKSRQPIQVEILENLTPYPSERSRPKVYAERLAEFLPILKTFSEVQIENGTLALSAFDLTRRSVIFDQSDVKAGAAFWTDFKAAMASNSVAVVNAHDLEQGQDFRPFFASEIARRLEGAGNGRPLRIIIIISGPMELGPGKPLEISAPPAGDFSVFYVKCDFPQTSMTVQSRLSGSVTLRRPRMETLDDGIGKAVKKLKPRVFDVSSAERMREALAAILADLSRL